MDDDEEVRRESHLKTRMDVASNFGKSANIEESLWFLRRGERKLAGNERYGDYPT